MSLSYKRFDLADYNVYLMFQAWMCLCCKEKRAIEAESAESQCLEVLSACC